MAVQLPSKLKTGDIQRFAVRAAQLEKYKPIVSYWCEYYILQQVLNKNLHTSDEECQSYAIQLMDKLEQTKADSASNDAIVDDVAAKAYIENFALDTFSRADNAQRANQVTKQTADTFMAAATFLDMLSIWGEVDREVAAKSKFAKFHAARILRAFKAGEDPNATNPVVEEHSAPAEDGMEAELQELERAQNGPDSGVYRPPTVESAGHSGLPSRPESTVQGEPTVPPPQRTPDGPIYPPPPQQDDHEVSPIEPAESAAARQNSAGGGYFPTLPSGPPDVDMLDHAGPPSQPPQQPIDPQDFYNTSLPPPPDPTAPSPGLLGMGSSTRPSRPGPDRATAQPPAVPYVQQPQAPPFQPRAAPAPAPAPPPAPMQQGPPAGGYLNDDESTMAAQKHARWAISALNFEDANTAVKELRLALQSLGAT
ncbi:hypothetical protein LTR37_006330 [Vermiconidia calcicola]|uniref:Uncharacterized protein n=1 Tax=Vermiconidia calcicola TaxID=1690605 RepID=A0ACC3NH73_9PEZI|nr:hypothetical protein LTR37_006330 [Vermiconidia calcicola]